MSEKVEHHVPSYPGRETASTIERKADEMKELFAKKNADYAGSAGTYANVARAAIIASWFEDETDKVFATMLGIKLARLATLKRAGKTPNFESVQDTHADFKTYAAIWEAWEIDRDRDAAPCCAFCGTTDPSNHGAFCAAIGSEVPTHAL